MRIFSCLDFISYKKETRRQHTVESNVCSKTVLIMQIMSTLMLSSTVLEVLIAYTKVSNLRWRIILLTPTKLAGLIQGEVK